MTTLQSRTGAEDCVSAARPPTVLVVDDDDVLRLVLTRDLRRRGFDVYSTGSGAEAVEMYCRSTRQIDIVLMDVNMPGTSGPEALAGMRAAVPGVRCCFMTADARPETRSALRKAGGREVLTKPFVSLAEVCVTLRRLADGPPNDRRETAEGEYAGSDSARRLYEEGE